jgi:hypothetical protein
LRQIDRARGDVYAIERDLDVIMKQLARLPTRKELAQTALLRRPPEPPSSLPGSRRCSDDD